MSRTSAPPAPSPERFRLLVKYDPETGSFTNRVARGNRRVGDVLGTINADGYVLFSVDGVQDYAHRWAFYYMEGRKPKLVDHDDRNRSNNAWINLIDSNKSKNGSNRGAQSNNKLGIKGVSWITKSGRYAAQLIVGGKRVFHKEYDTVEEATAAYEVAVAINPY